MGYTIDIDIGGTYTDGFFSDGRSATLVKVDTTPHDLTLGFHRCLEEGSARLGLNPFSELLKQTEVLRFSTTVCDNLLIQRKGPKLGLLVTAGFEATLYADRHTLFDFLISPDMVAGIAEEIDGQGEVAAAPRPEEVAGRARYLLQNGARMLVISLRNAARNSTNERTVKQILDRAYPSHYLGHVPVLLAHQISRHREDARRTETALVSAYLHKALLLSLSRTEDALRRRGYVRPLFIVHANLGAARVARTRAIDTYNSGPAAAHYGAARLSQEMGLQRVLALDVGGTSTEISVLLQGRPMLTSQRRIADFTVGGMAPVIHSLGAGGGSIARMRNGRLTVGPESAGALPGPACYDLGGVEPTATDAFLAAGFLDPGHYMGGARRLNPERTLQALKAPAEALHQPAAAIAATIIDALIENIAAAVKRAVPDDDPATFDLFAFGGCGGLVAASIAELLDIARILTFPFGAVFSAFGSANLEIVHQYEIEADGKIDFSSEGLLPGAWLETPLERSRKEFAAEGIDAACIRYQLLIGSTDANGASAIQVCDISAGQGQLSLAPFPGHMRPPDTLWLRAIAPMPRFHLGRQAPAGCDESKALKGVRPVNWKGAKAETRVYDRSLLLPGARVVGPALVESESTTVAVPAGWSFAVNPFSIGILERSLP